MTKLAEYDKFDGLGLAKLVDNGDVSPAELVEACIERIERLNPKINAVVHKMYDRARRRAENPDLPKGPFRGVPFLLKDLKAEDIGEPSTASCKLLVNWRAHRDCELVARYKRSGLVIVGRTNTPELGIYGVTEPALRGPTRNPWNLEHTPGGSSGGSSAAVAARIVPMAHGGDGGGSIRIPSSHCGLVGLKPTRARNPAGPFTGEGWAGLVSEHVLTRTVRDSAAMLDATSGPDVGAPYQVRAPDRPYLEESRRPPGKLRIAFSTTALFGDKTDADCVNAVHRAAELAESLGHTVEEASPPFDKALLIRAYLLMVSAGVSTSIREIGEQAGVTPQVTDFEPATWSLKLIADHVSATDYLYHRRVIHKAAREIGQFFERYDVFLTPTAARPPVRVGEFALSFWEKIQLRILRAAPLPKMMLMALDEMAKGPLTATPNTMLFNLTGQPAISLPLHWNAAGLPIGTQWVGRFGDEATLFRLAAQLEQAQPWATRLPGLLG